MTQHRVPLLMDANDSDATEVDSDYASDDELDQSMCPVITLFSWSRWGLNPRPPRALKELNPSKYRLAISTAL